MNKVTKAEFKEGQKIDLYRCEQIDYTSKQGTEYRIYLNIHGVLFINKRGLYLTNVKPTKEIRSQINIINEFRPVD